MKPYTHSHLTLFPKAGLLPIVGPSAANRGSSWFRVAAESRCFDGHFEGAPILPGVAQLALALTACSLESGRPRVLTGVRDVRFTRPLGPGDEVEVVLTEGEEPASVRFEIRSHGEPASAGLLVFEPHHDGSRS